MMKNKISLLFLTILLSFGSSSFAASKIISHGKGFDTRFLIVIDSKSYAQTTEEVHAYKEVLEKEGLGVVLLIGDWKNPDALKKEIIKIYKQKPVLEGAVFVGDIPVVRVRNFQHATTAFKMNEVEYPKEESSVTSDRFYDDLDLKFEFLTVDEKNNRHFYYKLKEDSPQVIESEFYSARMLPPVQLGENPYALLKAYLKKVVAAHQEVNYADHIKFFNGHGYNFDDLTVWENQQYALKEQFPIPFRSAQGNAFYNFRQHPFMKFNLYEKMQLANTDLFVFHEHGAYDTQYINGEYTAPNQLGINKDGLYGPLEVLSISIRNTYRRYFGDRKENFKVQSTLDYGLSSDFFDEKHLNETKKSDSIFAASFDIRLDDLKNLAPQSRVTIFDACYNGSFHQNGYIAGYHIFTPGRTVVTQGNTVNVLQDKWSMELIGMLAEGSRIGFWHKEVQTLEAHLVGDPTYRFHAGTATHDLEAQSRELNLQLALSAYDRNPKVWMEYLKSDNPNFQSIALKQLSKMQPANYEDLLLETLKTSTFYSVRMQALQRILYSTSGKHLTEALILALDDPYELIRRNAARFSGYHGDERLIPLLVNTMMFSEESSRVQYAVQMALPMFPAAKVQAEFEKQSIGSHVLNSERLTKEAIDYFNKNEVRAQANLAKLQDKSAAAEDRISSIRGLRNGNNHTQVKELLEVLKDENDDQDVRTILAEALGWFNWSYRKVEIIEALEQLQKSKRNGKELKAEIDQTLIRLKG